MQFSLLCCHGLWNLWLYFAHVYWFNFWNLLERRFSGRGKVKFYHLVHIFPFAHFFSFMSFVFIFVYFNVWTQFFYTNGRFAINYICLKVISPSSYLLTIIFLLDALHFYWSIFNWACGFKIKFHPVNCQEICGRQTFEIVQVTLKMLNRYEKAFRGRRLNNHKRKKSIFILFVFSILIFCFLYFPFYSFPIHFLSFVPPFIYHSLFSLFSFISIFWFYSFFFILFVLYLSYIFIFSLFFVLILIYLSFILLYSLFLLTDP